MQIFGEQWTRQQVINRVGDISQLCGVKGIHFMDGLEHGTKGLHAWNAAGLQFYALPDRGMDIGAFYYKGIPLAWMSKSGYVHPAHLHKGGWLAGFHGGMLATCGLNNVGRACEDEEGQHEMHGRISRLPAAEVSYGGSWTGDNYSLAISGKVNDASSLGDHMQLHRRIEVPADQPVIRIYDQVTNLGAMKMPCMIKYHMNLGFPLVQDDTSIEVANRRRLLRNSTELIDPRADYFRNSVNTDVEMLYHECEYEHDQMGEVTVRAPYPINNEQLALKIRYKHDTLPHLWQWNNVMDGLYVTAIEPSNCLVKPRSEARRQGLVTELEPGESMDFAVEVSIVNHW